MPEGVLQNVWYLGQGSPGVPAPQSACQVQGYFHQQVSICMFRLFVSACIHAVCLWAGIQLRFDKRGVNFGGFFNIYVLKA